MGSLRRIAALLLALLPALSGCATQRELRADLMGYLYPYGAIPSAEPEVKLTLPLRVGIAFVPGGTNSQRGDPKFGSLPDFSEPEKRAVLERVAAAFRDAPEIAFVEVLPTQNLSARGGFSSLEQVSSMYGANLVALVSYSQVQYTDPSRWSVLYWTLVLAYFLPADKVETQTLIDASVFDIGSRALLFSGSGADISHTTSTPFERSEKHRRASSESFEKAADKLIESLKRSIGVFRENAKTGTVRGMGTPRVQVVESRPGYSSGSGSGIGAGAFGPLEFGAALALAALGAHSARRRRARV